MGPGSRCRSAGRASAGCGGGSNPSRDDVLAVGELTYPGAIESGRNWRPEDHDVSVDGLDLSNVAELSRRFRLRNPVSRDDLFAWYGEQLDAAGWSERPSGDNDVVFVRSVDDRSHTYRVEAGTELVDGFTVTYRIGFAG